MKVTLLLLAGSLAAAQVEQSGCRALRGDASWPADAVWKSALPGVTAHDPQADIKRPDYRFDAKSADDVVKAVKFAAQNNVRLSILNSGHDFLGRLVGCRMSTMGISLICGETVPTHPLVFCCPWET